MNIKKTYCKPVIEDHLIDQVVNLGFQSTPPIGTPDETSAQQASPTLKSTPSYQDMPTQYDAFGNDYPDYTSNN